MKRQREKREYDTFVLRLITESIFWIAVVVALYFLVRLELWYIFVR